MVWNLYIECNIHSLPVSVITLCFKLGVKVLSYIEADKMLSILGLKQECLKRDAFAMHDFLDDHWYIFYNGEIIPRQQIKFNIAHELGHILLGHELEKLNINHKQIEFSKHNPVKSLEDIFEKDVFMFAIRLFAPAGILAALNIHSQYDIEYLCDLPPDIALIRAKRMKILYKRDKFYTSKLEQKILEQFDKFIVNYPIKKY